MPESGLSLSEKFSFKRDFSSAPADDELDMEEDRWVLEERGRQIVDWEG